MAPSRPTRTTTTARRSANPTLRAMYPLHEITSLKQFAMDGYDAYNMMDYLSSKTKLHSDVDWSNPAEYCTPSLLFSTDDSPESSRDSSPEPLASYDRWDAAFQLPSTPPPSHSRTYFNVQVARANRDEFVMDNLAKAMSRTSMTSGSPETNSSELDIDASLDCLALSA
ncbi:hypothetical protein CYLTODRAFT_427007 [Cylindrobasidium torrendii FP15055 ss-10]|uniref:Uncharacterized protein n=1 Tax=Cylindrobasidium torrendii FP15055 ss-10 TaxID=1314674 RepID=A0A0D7AWH0_9AGAR|nr:hypothetical protein CYLTODRAFT_427007 [Cylindrobasidium torrendii FP15055 ss-10]